ncbi:uncharacterized protein EDB91DRAFT_1252346 [Suillus paluster]|uniref:uncharacterized protein n=1 Tax=Suillus paluster TaxID=48578 RepID=UPI001B85FCF8|nr:uncharacterized protein EDB91DRAFT_1252346 [Suillus paluster]KAG1731096.1 hypothetical protein EDB91DRAFT_1252346 [Suillus paluster]
MGQKFKASTPSKKAAAIHTTKLITASEGQLVDESGPRLARQAKSNAYKNQVWMLEKSTTCKHATSNGMVSDHIKLPQVDSKDATSAKHSRQHNTAPTATEMFDSDNSGDDGNKVAVPSDDFDEHQSSKAADLEDDLKALKFNKKKLKQVLDYECPQLIQSTRSKSTSSQETQMSHIPKSDIDDNVHHTVFSDADDDLQLVNNSTKGVGSKCWAKPEDKKPTWRNTTEELCSNTQVENLITALHAKLVRRSEDN